MSTLPFEFFHFYCILTYQETPLMHMKRPLTRVSIFLLAIFLSCGHAKFERTEIVNKRIAQIFNDNDFVKVFARYTSLNNHVTLLQQSGYTLDEIDKSKEIIERISEIKSILSGLEHKYNDFDNSVKTAFTSNDVAIVNTKFYMAQLAHDTIKTIKADTTQVYACGSKVATVCDTSIGVAAQLKGCNQGCAFFHLSCLQSNLTFFTCAAIRDGCYRECCSNYCEIKS